MKVIQQLFSGQGQGCSLCQAFCWWWWNTKWNQWE